MTDVTNARGVLLSYSAASLHHFSATGAGPLLEGSDGPDSFWGDNGVTVTLAGGAGDDIYNIYGPRNTALEEAGQGIDTLKTWMSMRLPAHIENLVVTGAGRHAFGNDLDNIITGGSGRQTLDGGRGDDVLIGGAGGDIFAVEQGNGSDLILDFTGDDSLRLTGYGLSSFDQVAARLSQQDDDVVLDLGGGEILVFANTALQELQAGQFDLEVDLTAMTPSFTDNFNSLALWDGVDGTWESNFWWGAANGSTLASQQQWYIDTDHAPTQSLNPFSVDDGVLTITAAPAPEGLRSEIEGYAYTSGLLTTYRSFEQTYGYFEIRADMPEGKGLWPAFWLLPADGRWPPELDVVELAGQDPNRLILTAHSKADGSHSLESLIADVSDTEGFHRFGVLWGPEEIVWTYDGTEVMRANTPADMHVPMYMVVNLGLGGFAGEPGAEAAAGAEMKVDYIRAYSLDEASLLPVQADGGNDTLIGTAAGEVLQGGSGDDLMYGKAGDDRLFGEAGDDILHGNVGIDYFDGGSGSDTVDFRLANIGLRLDLAAGEARLGAAPDSAVERLVSIENVTGGRGNDTLIGDDGANVLRGREGSDSLTGGRGADLLGGGSGADLFCFMKLDRSGGDGHDSITGFGRGQDRLAFGDVIDADGDGDADLGDLLAAVGSVSDSGLGGDVTVAFDNGATITFLGAGTGAVDSLTDLVNNAATQIEVS
ncbi:MAG: family 16 glycosylhydrolase [Kiloniellaceae bacterium]|nr:family 16 glycosylhydrolase [Kiloniellaceae bacterium]